MQQQSQDVHSIWQELEERRKCQHCTELKNEARGARAFLIDHGPAESGRELEVQVKMDELLRKIEHT